MASVETRHAVSRPAADGTHVWSLARRRTNDPVRQQIKSACADCNNGWMSVLQKAAAPIAIPFVKGEYPYLMPAQRRILAAWATMVTMNIEYWDPQTAGVSAEQRAALRDTSAPLPNWYVGMGTYAGGTLDGVPYHRGLVSKRPEAVPGKSDGQTTVFALGKAFFHTISVSFDTLGGLMNVDPQVYGRTLRLDTLWPGILPLPMAPPLITDRHAEAIIGAIGGPAPRIVQPPDV